MKRGRFQHRGLLAITADSLAIEFDMTGAPSEPFEACGDFAVVAIDGPLTQRDCIFWDSYEAIEKRVAAAFASEMPAVLLRISSPGGQVAGCFELARELRKTAKASGKRLVAYVDGLAASAAYALACAAERIVLPETGVVGSIGCMQVVVDETARDKAAGLGFEIFTSGARKADGNPHVALSDVARSAIQEGVDDMAGTFFGLVADARSLSPKTVAGFQAAVFVGTKAISAGLADEVMTFAELIASGGAEQMFAQTGAEDTMTKEEEAKAALQAIADGDDEKAAARAKKALAAYDAEDDGEKKDDEKKESDAKAEDDSEEKKDDEKKESDAKASASAKSSLALAARLQTLEARAAEREEKEERAKLMASRPDLAEAVVAFLDRQPLAVVRDAVKNLPRGSAKGQIGAARAALGVTPPEARRDEREDRLSPEEAHDLDVQMGLARRHSAIRMEGNRLFLGVMSPDEARAELARRDELARKGAAK